MSRDSKLIKASADPDICQIAEFFSLTIDGKKNKYMITGGDFARALDGDYVDRKGIAKIASETENVQRAENYHRMQGMKQRMEQKRARLQKHVK